MITLEPKAGERVLDVRVTEDTISVDLYDGRTITAPLAWFPRLLHATPGQRANWRVAGAGYGIHWPDIDEDLTYARTAPGISGSQRGRPSGVGRGIWRGAETRLALN